MSTATKVNKSTMRILAHFFIFIGCIIQLQAQSGLILRLDSAVVETGEAFYIHLEAPAEPDTLDLSAWSALLSPDNILAQSPWVKSGNTWKKDLQVIVFEASDSLVLPPLTVHLREGALLQSDPLPLTVVPTPVPSNDLVDMADLKEIHRESKDWTDYIWLIWLVAGLGITLLVLYWISKRKKQAGARYRSSELSAYELAIRKLDQLEAQQLWQKGDIKTYYATLSAIVRAYIDDRYQLQTQKSGAEDASVQIRRTDMDPHTQALLLQLLRNADLAKYAKGQPDPSYHPKAIADARGVISEE